MSFKIRFAWSATIAAVLTLCAPLGIHANAALTFAVSEHAENVRIEVISEDGSQGCSTSAPIQFKPVLGIKRISDAV